MLSLSALVTALSCRERLKCLTALHVYAHGFNEIGKTKSGSFVTVNHDWGPFCNSTKEVNRDAVVSLASHASPWWRSCSLVPLAYSVHAPQSMHLQSLTGLLSQHREAACP